MAIILSSIGAVIFFLYFADLGMNPLIEGEYKEALKFIIFGMLPGYIIYLEGKSKAKSSEFPDWIKPSRYKIKNGNKKFNGRIITLDTNLVRYKACVSFMFVTYNFKSDWRFVITADPIKILYTLCTICFGWWGMPFGPWSSFKAIKTNLMGGERTDFRKILRKIK